MNCYEYYKRTGKWQPSDFMKSDVIKVRKVGENDGYYRTYYFDDVNNKYYAVTDFRGTRTWYTTDCNDGEPDCPLKDGLLFAIIEEGRVVRRERISRESDCDSIGITEQAWVTCLHCNGEFFGWIAYDNSGAYSYCDDCDASFDVEV